MKWFSATLPLLRGGFYEPSSIFMGKFPVPVIPDDKRALLIGNVQKILHNPSSPDVPQLEAEINKMVYDAYNLTPEEILIVEEKQTED
jgi:hypothetical protein